MSIILPASIDIFEGNNVTIYTAQTPAVNAAYGPFLDINGNPFDPDLVEFSYIVQGRTPINFTYSQEFGDPTVMIVRIDVGIYEITLTTIDQVGRWVWRWYGHPNIKGNVVNTNAAACEGLLNVLPNDVGV